MVRKGVGEKVPSARRSSAALAARGAPPRRFALAGRRQHRATFGAVALLLVLSAVGCTSESDSTGHIKSVQVTNETCTAGICGLPRLTTAVIAVDGDGVCSFRVVFGDGSVLPVDDYDFGSGPRIVRYSGFAGSWPGPKTIRAVAEKDCLGSASVLHHVFTHMTGTEEEWRIGMNEPQQLCYDVPAPGGGSFPALRPATRVHITAATTPEVAFGTGVHYDPDGQPGTSAPQSFSFPGFRKYSLILTVGNETFQGGTNTTFNVVQGGDLLLCQNDDEWRDNLGGWQVNIFVDESQAP